MLSDNLNIRTVDASILPLRREWKGQTDMHNLPSVMFHFGDLSRGHLEMPLLILTLIEKQLCPKSPAAALGTGKPHQEGARFQESS